MPVLSAPVIIMFLVSAGLQVLALSFLPATQGYTKAIPTVVVGISYFVAMGLLAKLIQLGVNLSILIPFLAAGVPIVLIGIGVFVLGEPASYAKLALLLVASGLIGYASTLG